MAINTVQDQFKFSGRGPYDAKCTPVNTVNDLNSNVTSLQRYDGLTIWVISERRFYTYNLTTKTWHPMILISVENGVDLQDVLGYEGQILWVKNEKCFYKFDGDVWSKLITNSTSESGSKQITTVVDNSKPINLNINETDDSTEILINFDSKKIELIDGGVIIS